MNKSAHHPGYQRFCIKLQQVGQWFSDHVIRRLSSFPPVSRNAKMNEAIQQDFNVRLRSILNIIPQTGDVIVQRKSGVVSFRNGDEFYVFKVFLLFDDYLTEARLLQQFDQDPVLSKYIVPFDIDTLKGEGAVIYKKMIPLTRIINTLQPGMIRELIDWNRVLLEDMDSRGLRLCDHKIDNVLYDMEHRAFFITDLEAVTNQNSPCRVITFVGKGFSISPLLFDYIHFLGSFYDTVGLSKELEMLAYRAAIGIHGQVQQHVRDYNVEIDFILCSLIAVSVLRFDINDRLIDDIAPLMLRQDKPMQIQHGKYAISNAYAEQTVMVSSATPPDSDTVQRVSQLIQAQNALITSQINGVQFFRTADSLLREACKKIGILLYCSYIRHRLVLKRSTPPHISLLIADAYSLMKRTDEVIQRIGVKRSQQNESVNRPVA